MSGKPRLDGQVALVTGSSTGMGEAIARRFAQEGALVVINSARSVEQVYHINYHQSIYASIYESAR